MEPSFQPSRFKLTAVNTLVATLAGIISITGGLYSIKNTVFNGQGVGSLSGIVRDEAIAKPLLGAVVEVSNANNLVIGTYYTDRTGHYEIVKLKEGPYIVKISAVKHAPQLKTITILRDQTSTVHFDLSPIFEESKPMLDNQAFVRPSVPLPVTPSYYSPPNAVPPPPGYSSQENNRDPVVRRPFLEDQSRRPAQETFARSAVQSAPSYYPLVQTTPSSPGYSQRRAGSNMTQALVQTGLELISGLAEKKKRENQAPATDETRKESV